MTDDEIKSIEALLNRVPKTPWHFNGGDELDHWELWSSDRATGYVMVNDDSGTPPDPDFIEYVLKSRDIIERLLNELKNRLMA